MYIFTFDANFPYKDTLSCALSPQVNTTHKKNVLLLTSKLISEGPNDLSGGNALWY
jgi:hypothetical protein